MKDSKEALVEGRSGSILEGKEAGRNPGNGNLYMSKKGEEDGRI